MHNTVHARLVPLFLLLLLGAFCTVCHAIRVQPPPVLSEQKQLLLDTDNFDDDCIPKQVHLALGRDPTEMHVSWKTASSNCPSEVKYQQLTYDSLQEQDDAGDWNDHGVANVVGYSFLLSERDMCSEPAASNEFMLYLHRAVLKGLEPGMDYRYRIVGADRAVRFRAAPELSPDQHFTFLGFGDMGDSSHSAAKSPGAASTLLRLHQEVEVHQSPCDLILHVGDISYADGDPDVWDSFMDEIHPIASRVPYMVAIGNHEYGYSKGSGAVSDPSGADGPYQPSWGNYGSDSRGECGVMTARRFHMPRDDDSDNPPFWYSFDYGSVHFTVLSTEHSVEPSSRQYRWLQGDLAAVDRCTTPWLVVLLHRPMYVVYPHKSNREVGEHIRNSIEPLLLHHKVDMTISGHVHSYYRTCPVADESCIPGYTAGYTVSANPDLFEAPDAPANNQQDEAGAGAGSRDADHGGMHRNSYGCGPAAAGDAGDGSVSNRCRHGIMHFVIGSAGRKLSEVEQGQEVWCAAKEHQWGYGRFTVEGRDRLLMEFVSSESGEVLDAVTVRSTAVRDRMCRAWEQRGSAANGSAQGVAPAA